MPTALITPERVHDEFKLNAAMYHGAAVKRVFRKWRAFTGFRKRPRKKNLPSRAQLIVSLSLKHRRFLQRNARIDFN